MLTVMASVFRSRETLTHRLMPKTIVEESQVSGGKFIQKTEITSRPRRASTQIMSPCVVKRSVSAKKVTPQKSLKTKIVKSESEEESEFSEVEEESSDDEIVVKAGRPSLAKNQVCTIHFEYSGDLKTKNYRI